MRLRRLFLPTIVFFFLFSLYYSCHAWTWSDYIRGDFALFFSQQQEQETPLSLSQVSEMRVRDIKRRLARSHGYSADELGRMLDKKELIEALAFEEHKTQLQQRDDAQRRGVLHAIIVTVVAGALVLLWPLIKHAYDVAHVHLVVYTDRKRLEVRRCWELQSYQASVGVLFLFLVDALQMWLTVSVILSWVLTSRYLFPVPSLPIRPAAIMGSGPVASGSLSRYGINVGPMVCAWGFRFLQGKLTTWTGRALSNAARRRAQTKKSRQESRQDETREEKEARRAARRALKAAREKEQQQQQQKQQQKQQQQAFSHDRQSQEEPEQSMQESSENVMPSHDEKRNAAAAAAEARCKVDPIVDSYTAMDELD